MSDHGVILLAEDREDDVFLIHRAFEKGGIDNPLYVVRNGEDAIRYLEGVGRFVNRAEYPLPDLLLLDLKMPGTDGFEVLRWIKQQPRLSSLRIIVLTASSHLQDVNLAYQLGANSFMVKPFDFENTLELAKLITEYWLRKSKTPEISRPSVERKKPTDQGRKT
jgi:CheY-like chemotaxis protein